jgi:septum site-determining protein MinC
MAVENPSRTLVGPHLPPIVTGGRPVDAMSAAEPEAPAAAPPAAVLKAKDKQDALIVDAHVRSGQSIVNLAGDVVVIGRVSSGAEIVAGGSVHIYGALQGRVFAGVSGLAGARIFCTEARAEMLCIGGAHVTAEDIDPKADGRAIEVRLDGDELKIRIID